MRANVSRGVNRSGKASPVSFGFMGQILKSTSVTDLVGAGNLGTLEGIESKMHLTTRPQMRHMLTKEAQTSSLEAL